MGTIYRKTAKGVAEIETRALRLAPRFRQTLILVDGRRSNDELARLMPQGGDEALEALLAAGLIEVIGQTVRPAADGEPRRGSGAPRRAEPPPPAPSFESQRFAVAKALTETVGPIGDDLGTRIERSRDPDELFKLVEVATRMISGTRGRLVAAEFAQRFGRPPPGAEPGPG